MSRSSVEYSSSGCTHGKVYQAFTIMGSGAQVFNAQLTTVRKPAEGQPRVHVRENWCRLLFSLIVLFLLLSSFSFPLTFCAFLVHDRGHLCTQVEHEISLTDVNGEYLSNSDYSINTALERVQSLSSLYINTPNAAILLLSHT